MVLYALALASALAKMGGGGSIETTVMKKGRKVNEQSSSENTQAHGLRKIRKLLCSMRSALVMARAARIYSRAVGLLLPPLLVRLVLLVQLVGERPEGDGAGGRREVNVIVAWAARGGFGGGHGWKRGSNLYGFDGGESVMGERIIIEVRRREKIATKNTASIRDRTRDL